MRVRSIRIVGQREIVRIDDAVSHPIEIRVWSKEAVIEVNSRIDDNDGNAPPINATEASIRPELIQADQGCVGLRRNTCVTAAGYQLPDR